MDRWSSMGTRIRWNDGNYLTLIKAMSANLMLLNMDTPAIDREMAWHRVYKSLERSGMPSCSMKAVKSIWHRLRLKARENIERYRKQKRNKVKNISQLSPTDQAIQELLDKYKFVAKKIRMENKIKKSNAALKSSPSTRVSTRLFAVKMIKNVINDLSFAGHFVSKIVQWSKKRVTVEEHQTTPTRSVHVCAIQTRAN